MTEDKTIPVRVNVNTSGNYTLYTDGFSAIPLSPCIILEDMLFGVFTDFRIDSSYSFWIYDTTDAPRFLLHFGAPVSKTTQNISCFGSNDGWAVVSGHGSGPWDYIWTTEAGDTLKNTQNVYAPDSLNDLSPGIYSVYVTNGSVLCGDVSDTIAITEPEPLTTNIDHTNVSCNGESDGSATLTTSGGTAPYSYSWSTGEVTQDILSLPAGIYTVSVSDSLGCTVVDSITVTEPVAVIANFSADADTAYLSEDGTVQFTNSSSGATSYRWDFGDGSPENTSTNPVHVYSDTGIYTVTLVASTGICQDISYYEIIILDQPNPVSIEEWTMVEGLGTEISILPADKGVDIEFNFKELTGVNISVYNLLGQKVISGRNFKVMRDRIRLDLSDEVSGVYFIKIEVAAEGQVEDTFTGKVVVSY
ncbi:MAG: T9SS type A sorting domain-containing protein [Bacteroidota bacterium]